MRGSSDTSKRVHDSLALIAQSPCAMARGGGMVAALGTEVLHDKLAGVVCDKILCCTVCWQHPKRGSNHVPSAAQNNSDPAATCNIKQDRHLDHPQSQHPEQAAQCPA